MACRAASDLVLRRGKDIIRPRRPLRGFSWSDRPEAKTDAETSGTIAPYARITGGHATDPVLSIDVQVFTRLLTSEMAASVILRQQEVKMQLGWLPSPEGA